MKKNIKVAGGIITGKKQNRHGEINFPSLNHYATNGLFELVNELNGVHFRLDSNSIYIDLASCSIEQLEDSVVITEL